MRLTDTHCHLYATEFKDDIETMMQQARNAGVATFYMPGIDSSVIDAMLQVEANYGGECFPMMGLHPCSVKENYTEELKIIEGWLAKRKFVAIGEIGLDFYWDKTFMHQQYEAFAAQMELALSYKLPIVIHTRNAMAETIEAIKPYAARGLTGIFHCFGESKSFAEQIIALGFYLGIGGVITYKKSGLAETLAGISLDYIVLETDAPYLAPVPYRGKRNESSYIRYVADRLAEVKGISIEEVAEATSRNAEKIFGR